MIRVLLLLCALLATPAMAAVTTIGTATSNQGNSSTASTANTVASGSDVCYIAWFANSSATGTMANFGGVAPQLVSDFNSSLHLYRVINPAAGATTAQATLSAAVFWSIHVQCFDGVDTADPDDAAQTAIEIETTSVSTPAITSAVGDMVVALGLMVFGDIATFAGSSLSTEEEAIDGSVVSTALVYEAGAASVTTGVSSSTQSFGDNQILAVNVNASAGGGSSGLLRRRRGN